MSKVIDARYVFADEEIVKNYPHIKEGEPYKINLKVEVNPNKFADACINLPVLNGDVYMYTIGSFKDKDGNRIKEGYSDIHQSQMDVYDAVIDEVLKVKHLNYSADVTEHFEKLVKACDKLFESAQKNNYEEFTFDASGHKFTVKPSLEWGADKKPSNVDYWMVYSNTIIGSDNYWKLCEDFVNVENILEREEKSKNRLIDVYITKLLPMDFIPYNLMTNEQKERYGDCCFSDWHKDVFGHRPHSDAQNECLQIFLNRGQDERDYVDYVRSCNANGKECPISFNDFVAEKGDRNCEIDNNCEVDLD